MSTDTAGSESADVEAGPSRGIVAGVRLDHPALVLRPTLETVTHVTVEPVNRTVIDGGREVLYVMARGDQYEDFEAGLASDPTVSDPVVVDRGPRKRVYRVTVVDAAVTVEPIVAEVGGFTMEAIGDRDGWSLTLRFPDRESLVAFNARCRETDVTVRVEHLASAETCVDGAVALTSKQRELLEVAHREGYFDVPRRISQDELAAILGVSKSAVSQRMRRALGQLCESSILY